MDALPPLPALTGGKRWRWVPGTLLLRGFTFWLPLIPGLYLLRWSNSQEQRDA